MPTCSYPPVSTERSLSACSSRARLMDHKKRVETSHARHVFPSPAGRPTGGETNQTTTIQLAVMIGQLCCGSVQQGAIDALASACSGDALAAEVQTTSGSKNGRYNGSRWLGKSKADRAPLIDGTFQPEARINLVVVLENRRGRGDGFCRTGCPWDMETCIKRGNVRIA